LAANALAQAAPIPLAPPVITATLLLRSMLFFLLFNVEINYDYFIKIGIRVKPD